MEVLRKDLAIVGAGPAGLSAAVYTVRSGLEVFVFDKGGGLVDEAPWVENYLGFEGIEGRKLIEKFRTHASKYTELNNPEEVIKVRKNQLFTITTNKREYNTSSLIFAMGGAQLKLGVKGESEFLGKGVSYCATCDGFFFRKKMWLL